MRESLDTSYRDIDNLRGNLEKELEKLKLVEFELMSPVDSDLITTAKRLDVLEADMHLRVARTVLVDARNAMTTGTDRGDPGSLKWRATADMAGKISGLEYLVRDASDRLLQVRKSLLLRLVSQARSQMISDPSADYGRLPALMTEYELVARGSRSSSDEVRAAISLFITE